MKILSKFYLLIMVLSITLAFTSCEKLSDEELLTNHIWRWDKITSASTNEDIQNIITVTNTLMTGATVEFRTDHTYTITALNNNEDGTWELGADNDILIMDGQEMTIVKLTKLELVIEGEKTDDTFGTYSATLYLKKYTI